MPYIDDVIKKRVLSSPERSVLKVIDSHTKSTWSSSLEDLEELARWATNPTSRTPPKVQRRLAKESGKDNWIELEGEFPDGTGVGDHLNMKLMIATQVGLSPTETYETYTLGTVKGALSQLANSDCIWRFRMHHRTYYASHRARKRIEDHINGLSDREKIRVDFQASPSGSNSTIDPT